ncbi:MAG: ATP-binding cassette domain-containing protein [Nostoc sp.]|uniref:ABC transporter ATP-binding protein n=1 Tax=Nostoc sp. TaxID=1180 RepID=UPI002FFD0F14
MTVRQPPLFQVREVTKKYRMGEVEVQALRSIDLDLDEKEFMVILGSSGSGKSTLLNILGGLDVPSSGSVYFRDRNLTNANEKVLTRFRRDCIGFVFQFYNLIPSLTARENVSLVTEIAAHPMRPREALELVDLGDRLDHFPSQLSGGEQQTDLAIAVICISVGAACLGGFGSVRKAISLPPAEAMRPEPPAKFRPSIIERLGIGRFLSPAGRIICRNLERKSVQAGFSILGIAIASVPRNYSCGVGILPALVVQIKYATA